MKTLAIEREFGSGGREIGMRVARELGIPYYDSNLIAKAADKYGISLDLLREYDEQKTGSLLYNIALFANYNQDANQQRAQGLFYGIQETIKHLYAEGPAVFIGRCSTEILKKKSSVISVYIYSSDKEEKISRISHVEKVSEADARKLMEKKDRQRKDYFKFWTDKDWSDRKNYDIELNTAKFSMDECAQFLAKAISAGF